MNAIVRMFILSFFFLSFAMCKPKNEEKLIIGNNGELIFKNWLKDTLKIINKEIYLDYKREILISKDSLSMDIVKSYNATIDPKGINEIKSKELIYAIDLLNRNGDLPKEKFGLKFKIDSYYSNSMIERLKYDYDSEVKMFHIIEKDKTIDYKFLKGNLLEKKIVHDRSDL